MKKQKEENKEFNAELFDQHIRKQEISNMLDINYMPYAMSVIISRSLPDIRDGLKPSQRKVLYTMKNMGLNPGHRSKSANIAGTTLRLNPHSDQSCYATMVRMVDHNETLLLPYVQGKGSFGKRYSRDMAYAASRYTEASLSPVAMELFKGINKNAIDMIDNYDGTMKEPSILPVSFPAVLANPTLGIAVGFASSIASFNLIELCNATIEYLKNPKSDLLDIMPAPDFSTGASIVYDKEEIEKIYKTGNGSIKIRSKYEINKKEKTIEIKQIPYSTTSEAIIESVISLCKGNIIKEINNIRDDTDKHGLTITIEYKKTCDPELLMLKLFKLTPLEDTFSCNFNVILNGAPRCLGVYDILREWCEFRKQCIIRMLNFDLQDTTDKLHLLYGLKKILLDIDKAINTIKNTEKDIEVVPNLMKAFDVDEVQATYIADMKLRNINKEYILNKINPIKDLENLIKKINKQLKSNAEIKKIIIKDLEFIRDKYGIERKTEIINADEIDEFDVTDTKLDCNLYITKEGYIKKINSKLIKEDVVNKLKDEDEILYEHTDDNTSDLLVFTDLGNVYKSKISEIPECRPQDFGLLISSVLNLEDEEQILFTYITKEYEDNLLIAFENGKVALFPINVYKTKTNRKMLKNGYNNTSKALLFDVVKNDEEKFYMYYSKDKKKLVFSNKNVSLKSTRSTQGIQMYRFNKTTKIEKCEDVSNKTKKSLDKYVANNYPAAGK